MANTGTVESGRHITQIGEGLSASGRLKDEAMERALMCSEGICRQMQGNDVDGIYAVATSAVREAVNGRDFIQEVKNKTGIDVNIISGDEEARITMLGVFPGLEITGKGCFDDGYRRGKHRIHVGFKGGDNIYDEYGYRGCEIYRAIY